MIFENRCSFLFQALDSCAFKAFFGHLSCHDKNRLGRADESLNMHVHCLLGLRHMTTYERVKPATAGPVADTYVELKMLCLFYVPIEIEKKMAIMSGLQWYLKNNSIFPLFILCFILFLFQFPMSNLSHSSLM